MERREWSAVRPAGHENKTRSVTHFPACVRMSCVREEVALRAFLRWPPGRAALHGRVALALFSYGRLFD